MRDITVLQPHEYKIMMELGKKNSEQVVLNVFINHTQYPFNKLHDRLKRYSWLSFRFRNS